VKQDELEIVIKKKKKTIFSLLVILITISLVFALVIFNRGEKKNFIRMKFHSPETSFTESYDGKIPGFVRVTYKEGDKLHLIPGIEGERGILLSLNVVRDKGSEGGITVNISRGDNVVFSRSEEFKKRKFNFLLSDKFYFLKSDTLEISFTGSGEALLRDPIFYSIKDPGVRKYVFVIALDNLRYDRIGRQVNGVDLTPNLNKFMKDSVSFKNGYSQSSWTLPAFTSFFTGLNEFNHGMTRESVLSQNIALLTESLSSKFVTISINGGVWLGPSITGQRGFDIFRLGSRAKDVNAAENFFANSIAFLEENELPEMFMFMHTFSIHAPYYPPERFLYELEKKPKYKFMKALTHDRQFMKGVPDEERSGRELLYDADVKAFDFYFGKFIKYLREKNIYDQSLIAFISDHGEEFYEHGGWFHGHSHYDEMIRIPIILKLPANRLGGVTLNGNAGIIDVLPTIAELTGIKIPPEIDGISLVPMIKGENTEERFIFSSTTGCVINKRNPRIVAVIYKNYKYLYNIDNVEDSGRGSIWEVISDRGVEELYDLETDPGETINIVKDNPIIAGKLKRELIAVLKKIKQNSPKKITKKNQVGENEKARLKTLGYL